MNVECQIIPGATANAIKTAFDTWRNSFEAFGNKTKLTVISCTMFGVTDLIVFYYLKNDQII